MKLAWRLPWLSTLNVRFLGSLIRRNPARYINTMKFKVHDVDQVILACPEIQERLIQDFTEALRGGAQGMVDDMNANHGRGWGFPLDQIRATVHFWLCELDRSVSLAMGRYLSSTVPNCEATLVPDAGHLDVLTALVFGQSID
jgi:hypothetical protein